MANLRLVDVAVVEGDHWEGALPVVDVFDADRVADADLLRFNIDNRNVLKALTVSDDRGNDRQPSVDVVRKLK